MDDALDREPSLYDKIFGVDVPFAIEIKKSCFQVLCRNRLHSKDCFGYLGGAFNCYGH
jgi:hypothetical protein